MMIICFSIHLFHNNQSLTGIVQVDSAYVDRQDVSRGSSVLSSVPLQMIVGPVKSWMCAPYSNNENFELWNICL